MSNMARIRMGDVIDGPHIKRLLIDEASPPLVEIEPLQFFRVRWSEFKRTSIVSGKAA